LLEASKRQWTQDLGKRGARSGGGAMISRLIAIAVSSAIAFGLFTGISAKASTVTLDFPVDASTTFNSNGNTTSTLGSNPGTGVFDFSGSYIQQTFVDTGLTSAVTAEWKFAMTNFTALGHDNFFSVLINGNVVGTFDLVGTNLGRSQSFDLNFNFNPIAGEDYTLEILATSSVPLGGGSWNWVAGGTVTLGDGIATAVPEPSTWAMMIAGFLGLGFMGCRRRMSFRLA
jgi:hypothetical protein